MDAEGVKKKLRQYLAEGSSTVSGQQYEGR